MEKVKKKYPPCWSFYFDTETYKIGLQDFLNNDHTGLSAAAYSVGVCFHKGRYYRPTDVLTYRSWLGHSCLSDFVSYLEDFIEIIKEREKDIKKGERTEFYLIAFNLIYDIKFLLKEIKDRKGWLVDFYTDTNDKLILSGYISYKTYKIRFKCLYKWKANTSLANWINTIVKNNKNTSLNYQQDGITQTIKIESKSEIPYDKWDLYKSGDDYYYYTTSAELKQLDISQELYYLKIDVLSMPLIHHEQIEMLKVFMTTAKKQKQLTQSEEAQAMRMTKKKLTVVGVSKSIFDILNIETFDDIYRPSFSGEEIEGSNVFNSHIFASSRIGGFTCGSDITDYKIKKGEKIKSYDVNSMYPYIMTIGMPGGNPVYEETLKHLKGKPLTYKKVKGKYKLYGDYVPWVKVKPNLTGSTEWKKSIMWNGKRIKLPKFDNTYFGKSFLKRTGVTGFFITKLSWDMLNKTCKHNLEKEPGYYVQRIRPEIKNFVNAFYHIKQTETGVMRDVAKLVLNSMYGKAVEGIYNSRIKYGVGKINEDRYSFDHLDNVTNATIRRVLEKVPKVVVNLGGVYIVNVARLILLTAILDETANGNIFLYADTDSIKMIQRKPVTLYIDKDELGAWKDEGTFTNWIYPKKHKRYSCWHSRTKALLFKHAGLGGEILNLIKKDIKNIKTVMNHKNNVLFLDTKILNFKSGENIPILINVDFMTNNDIKPTHVVIQKDRALKILSIPEKVYNICNREIIKTGKENIKYVTKRI